MMFVVLTIQYVQLLLEICMKGASQEMKQRLRLRDSHILYIEPADLLVKPWDTEAIVDETGMLINDQADSRFTPADCQTEQDPLRPTVPFDQRFRSGVETGDDLQNVRRVNYALSVSVYRWLHGCVALRTGAGRRLDLP